MTELDAGQKRCCGPEGCGQVNGVEEYPARAMMAGTVVPVRWCIGFACMAWRWLHPGFDHDQIGNPISPQPPAGFCGLAGKP